MKSALVIMSDRLMVSKKPMFIFHFNGGKCLNHRCFMYIFI